MNRINQKKLRDMPDSDISTIAAIFDAPPGLRQHPLSAAFPSMDTKDFQSLKDSIMNLGVTNPVTLFEDMVLDGWHRYRAALELDSPCPARTLDGWMDPREFVMAQNKERRHVTVAQLALIAVQVWQWVPRGSNQHGSKTASALSADAPAKSTREIAESSGLGTRSIEQAKVVASHAAPEVMQAIEDGELGLPKAAHIARLPKDEQAAALHKPLPKKPARAPRATTPQQPPAPPAPQITPAGEDVSDISRADAAGDVEQLLADLQREIEELQAQIDALAQDGAKAQVLQAVRLQQQAERARDDAMDSAARSQSREKWAMQQLRRCGKALGIADDPRRIAPAVEDLARAAQAAGIAVVPAPALRVVA